MRIADMPTAQLGLRLRQHGLLLGTGPFVYRIRSPHAQVAFGIALLYAEHSQLPDDSFADFTVDIAAGRGPRRWLRRQSQFLFDGQAVFDPLPAAHAYPLLEWAMNWCISSQAHEFLVIHAAVVAHDDRAAILPAPPGSGKSTLCAALVHRGWRLLSDELALISLADGRLWPLCRPVGLKNASIDIIRRFAPEAVISAITHDTNKGDVSHMQAPPEHLARADVLARPRWVIYPRWQPGVQTSFQARPRAAAMMDLARNSFNFGRLGKQGFKALGDVVAASDCLDFRYSDLEDAVAGFDRLAAAT